MCQRDDTISRQAAIGAIDEIESEIAEGCGFEYEKWRKYFCDLPSAQPEITHCKDCKHKFIKNGVWNCPFGLPGGELFFCGYGNQEVDDEQRHDDLF